MLMYLIQHFNSFTVIKKFMLRTIIKHLKLVLQKYKVLNRLCWIYISSSIYYIELFLQTILID